MSDDEDVDDVTFLFSDTEEQTDKKGSSDGDLVIL